MASDDPPQFYDTQQEDCASCGRVVEHHVRLEVVTENEEYGGRQPYRITECQVCGSVEKERIGVGD